MRATQFCCFYTTRDYVNILLYSGLHCSEKLQLLLRTEVPIFVEHWGENLQFYPSFTLILTLGDEPRPLFCSGEQIK